MIHVFSKHKDAEAFSSLQITQGSLRGPPDTTADPRGPRRSAHSLWCSLMLRKLLRLKTHRHPLLTNYPLASPPSPSLPPLLQP